MAGYIGSKSSVTQVDGYNRTEADGRYVNASGDTMTGDLIVATKVGIGTGTPRNVIHAHDADNGGIRFSNTATGSGASDGFYVGNVFGSTDALLQNYEAGAIRFNTSATEGMRIDPSGNVLMGTTTSIQKLSMQRNTSIGWVNATDNGSDQIIYADSASNLNFYTNGSQQARIDSAGKVLVGTTSNLNSARLFVKGTGDACGFQVGSTSANQAAAVFYDGSGDYCGQIQLSPSSNTVGYLSSSDYRLKQDWQPIVGASDRVLSLNPVNFAWKADGTRVDGFLAHEAQAVVPESVSGSKDEVDENGNPVYQGIDQSKLVPLLTAALQEALGRIETLEADVAALKGATNV